jgi:hypothetical protein
MMEVLVPPKSIILICQEQFMKNHDTGFGSGMNNLHHISESLETCF